MQGNKSFLPHFNQHVTCANHLYSTHRDVYKAVPCPPFGKSDHNFILLIPAYKLKLKQETPVTQSIKGGQMKQMLNYRTLFLAQTGTCSGILPMALRSTPHQSLASSISASMTSSHSDCKHIPQPEAMDYRQHLHLAKG